MVKQAKRAILIARLIPQPKPLSEGCAGVALVWLSEEQTTSACVAEIERTCVFNSLAGEGEAAQLKEAVMDAFKPVHAALTEAMGKLAAKGIAAKTMFNEGEGFLIVTLEKATVQGKVHET